MAIELEGEFRTVRHKAKGGGRTTRIQIIYEVDIKVKVLICEILFDCGDLRNWTKEKDQFRRMRNSGDIGKCKMEEMSHTYHRGLEGFQE